MAIIEVHVHNHVDTREILTGLTKINVDVEKLLALASSSDSDRETALELSKDVKATNDALKAAIPSPTQP